MRNSLTSLIGSYKFLLSNISCLKPVTHFYYVINTCVFNDPFKKKIIWCLKELGNAITQICHYSIAILESKNALVRKFSWKTNHFLFNYFTTTSILKKDKCKTTLYSNKQAYLENKPGISASL